MKRGEKTLYFYILFFIVLFVPFFWKTLLPFKNMKAPFFLLPSNLIRLGLFFSSVLLFLTFIFYKVKTKEWLSFKLRKDMLLLLVLQDSFLFCSSKEAFLFLGCILILTYFIRSILFYEKISLLQDECTLFLNPIILWGLYLCSCSITCLFFYLTS